MPVYTDELEKIYLEVKDHCLQQYVKNAQPLILRGLKGHLVNITIETIREDRNNQQSRILGDQLQLHIIDADNYFIVKMWFNSFQAKSFLSMMENINMIQAITLQCKPVQDKETLVYKPYFGISQGGINLKWKYTKDNMQDCPVMVQDGILPNGRPKWDSTEQQLFFMQKIEGYMIPNLKRLPNPYPNHPLWEGLHIGNHIAGNYFGAEQRSGPRQHTASATNEPGIAPAAEITEPIDDLPF